MNKTFGALMIAASAIAYTANANATELKFNPYVGVDYNNTRANAKFSRPYFNSASVNVGAMYNDYFGTEVFYQHSDEYAKLVGTARNKVSMQAYGLDLMGYLPVDCGRNINIVGTIGIGDYEVKTKYIGSPTNRDGGYAWRYGAGVHLKLTNNVGVRGLVRYIDPHRISGYDHMIEYSLGLRYTF